MDRHLLSYASWLAEKELAKNFKIIHVLNVRTNIDRNKAIETIKDYIDEYFLESRDSVDFEIRKGNSLDELLVYLNNHHSDLVIVGHHSRAGGKRSLARRLAMLSPCSVLMIPDNSTKKVSKILATTDFSDNSIDTIDVSSELAFSFGLEDCLVLHVCIDSLNSHYDEHFIEISGVEEKAFLQFFDRCRRRKNEKRQSSFEADKVNLIPVFVEDSSVANGILKAAKNENCDLIVMNTRGRSTAASILLGSDTSQTFMLSSIPILAVKHRGSSMSFIEAIMEKEMWSNTEPKIN